MPHFDTEQARNYMHKLLSVMTDAGGSDLFVITDFPPSMKVNGRMLPLTDQRLPAEIARQLVESMMTREQRETFERDLECNFAISVSGLARFRVNVFAQQANIGMVMRTIPAVVPEFQQLGLPDILKEIVQMKRGLVLVVGATG
ncbi:MAG: type IV pili twitching motility protein PilT, partial [Betaproteobacteria bacterium]